MFTHLKKGFLGIAFLFARLIYYILKTILSVSGKNIIYKLSIIIYGYIDGITFNPVIEFDRNKTYKEVENIYNE